MCEMKCDYVNSEDKATNEKEHKRVSLQLTYAIAWPPGSVASGADAKSAIAHLLVKTGHGETVGGAPTQKSQLALTPFWQFTAEGIFSTGGRGKLVTGARFIQWNNSSTY